MCNVVGPQFLNTDPNACKPWDLYLVAGEFCSLYGYDSPETGAMRDARMALQPFPMKTLLVR